MPYTHTQHELIAGMRYEFIDKLTYNVIHIIIRKQLSITMQNPYYQ